MKKKFLKNSIIVFLLVLECISVYLGYKSFNEKNKDDLPNVKMATKEAKNTLAIMINEGDGTYIESTDREWPGDDYIYNASKSGCIDADGMIIPGTPVSYDSVNRKVQVTSNMTSYCYLYFDKK